ncbi:RidA family protein [Streptomyces piniterrae]|uniref:RidA family protein n=1 Tax=Streptomyces piniterrae TaxID=2571125 RepID=A0A4U0MU01_9ACTN|nr:RidA family protein [Streptomyces piniterrae]TJZ44470.1 RidA family protein [Streptomyces piniterrae]
MPAEARLAELGLTLPAELQRPPGLELPFAWVRVRRDRAFVAGHGALTPDGKPAGPFGKVPGEVPLEAAQESARLATLAVLASLRRALGSLDAVTAWLTVTGFVNAEPGYPQTTLVMNACSDLILDVHGPQAGGHARTAVGVTALPLDLPVIIATEVETAPPTPRP